MQSSNGGAFARASQLVCDLRVTVLSTELSMLLLLLLTVFAIR
jgi:hypothetical protein